MGKKVLKIVALLFCVIAILAIAQYAFSKFRDAFNANTEAEVAKWSFKVNGSTDEVQTFNLIETMDENSTVTEGMIAPGTSGSFNLEVDTTTTETDLTYTIEIELENKPENMRFYADSEFKKEYPVIDNKITINENILLEDNEPIRNTTIYWNWELITGNTEEEFLENDVIDSESMGQTIIANATVTGVQLEPESIGVSFTVYDYLENEDDTGYSLYGTRTITGLTETEVTLTKIATTITNASYGFGRLTPDGEQVDNISLAEDGSTVVYLYYQLDDYTITYDLQDGSLKSTEYNPLSYNKNTKSFTLHNPTKDGYIFLGWTGGVVDENGDIDNTANPGATANVTDPTETITIATGSFGNRKYTANWRSIGYIVNIHHYLAETGPEYGTEAVALAKDELLTSQVLGESYETYDLIPTLDSEGNITETDGREYLDTTEIYFVSDSGNTTGVYTEDEIHVYYYYQYYPVVRIVSSPATDLNGTEYTSIAKAMQALENAGLNASSDQSSLVLLKDIKDESALIENQNIQLDLAGFTLNSSSETEPTIELDNAKVVLVDNSDTKTGKVVSQNTVGVYISTNSQFDLGIEDETINTSPSIEANTKGIETEKTDSAEGIFNFFDGTITATTAIDGTVNLTPLLYSATVTVNENNRQVSTLGIVSGVEARIGRKTYLLLEDAIEDANTEINTDGSQVEIVVVQDLSKEAAVVVDETKNIKLDLDGHTITTTASDYVLKNYGTLEIVDSTADSENLAGTGKIVSTTNSVIYNDATGSLTIRAGTIGLEKVGTSSSYKSAIVNNGELYIGPEAVVEDETGSSSEEDSGIATASEENGIATISETEVSNIRPYIYSNKKYTNLVYGSGNTTVENGSFYSSVSLGYGIKTTGNVVINDGTYNTYTNAVSLTSSATADKTVEINGGTFEAGVLNESAGKIIINNGTFNDSVSVSNTNSVIQINNGTFTGQITANRGTVEINNGTFSGKVSLSNSGTVNVNDGTFSGGFSNYSSSKVNINGGTINSSISNGSGTMNINNATINYTGGDAISNGATLYIDKGTTITTTKGNPIENDEDGTVYLKECTINCEAAYYGVANSGVLVLGDNDEEISTEYPLINAIYGISNTTGTLKFYDGKIISNTGLTIRGNINELPENCEVLISVEDSKEIATVGEPIDPVAKIGETTYTTLQNAVDAVPTDSTNTKIELLKDVYLSETVAIPENKNITLDLMQYTIKGLHTGYVLDNSGILEIDSSSENTLPSVNISNKVDKANYYFVEQNGTLVSNNAGIKSTTANSYIPIDLTGLTGKYELNVNAQISSEIHGDIGYATVTQSTSIPTYSTSDGRFMYISGKVPATEYKSTLTGGNVYYLHLGYYKDSSVDSYDDIFTINNISIYPKGSILSYAKHNLINNTNKLSLNKADINLYAAGTSSSYLSVIENTGELEMNSGTISTSTNDYTMSVNNKESGSVVINGGTLSNTDTTQYGIQNTSTNNITVNGGYINAYRGIYNTSTGDIIVNNGRFYTDNSAGCCLVNSNEDGLVTINNGYFKGYERLISINYGKLIMNDAYLLDNTSTSIGYAAIEINNNSSFEMYNGTIYSNREAIETTATTGQILIHNGNVISRYGNTVLNKGTVNIIDGIFNTKSTSPSIQNTGTATIQNGTIQGSKRGITNSGTMTVLGGEIYGNSEIGIYTTGTLTIGTKDGNVSTEAPYIYGKTYGLSLGSSTVNFYDGKIEGASSQSISGTPTSIEDGYEIVKTIDSATSREIAILDIMPIAQVGTEQYYRLQEAFDACSDGVQTEVTILRNANIIQTTESATISENKDIILNLSGYEVVAGNDNTIIVEGKLQITDTTETAGTMKNTAGSLILMQGTGELTVSSVTLQETVAKNLITNNGTGNITVTSGNLIATTGSIIENNADSKVTVNGGTIQSLSGTSTSSGTGIALNAGDLEINDGATISTNGNSVYVNNSNSEVIINGGTLGIIYNNAAKLDNSQVANVTINAGDLKQIYNNAAGEIIVNNVTMDTGKEAVVNVSNGNIIVNTATITSYYDTFTNEGGGTIDIKDGTYTATYGGNCIYNSNGTINIENGTFTATTYTILGNGNSSTSGDCIMNINGGTFNQTYSEATTAIANGYKYGSDYTVEMNINKATIISRAGDGIKNYAKLTLGANDGVNNDADISITGNLYGVINIGTFNYYDGTIKASLNKSIYKTINAIPENAEIVYTKDTTTETATLANENVARIGETYYNSLSEAIKACSTTATESTTITLLKDIGIGGTGYEIKEGQNIILDLNGYRLNQFYAITNNGDFEITDSTEAKTGTIDVSNRMINNYSNFKMSAGNIYSYMYTTDNIYSGESIGTRSIIYNYENGNVELANVSLYNKVVGQGTSNIMYSISQNNVKLVNSTIETDGWYYNYDGSRTNVIYCNASSGSTNVEIENTNITHAMTKDSAYAIYINTSASVTMNSGTIGTFDYAIYSGSSNTGNINLNGGTIESDILINSANNVTLDGASISATRFQNCNDVVINSGTCTSNITIASDNSLTINGGTMNDTVQLSYTDTTINGGTIDNITIANSNVLMLGGEVNNTDGAGITLSSGTLTLGVKEYPVSTTEPVVTGSTYGVVKSGGTFNYYDGVITGTASGAISGTVDSTPELYTVSLAENGTVATLAVEATFEQVAIMNGIYYDSLQQAINAAGTTASTITLEKDNVMLEGLTIAENQNITLDLNGYSISTVVVENAYAITNSGTLTIVDTALTEDSTELVSKVRNYTGTAIKNDGTLTIGVDDSVVLANIPTIVGTDYGIENNGVLNIYDGKVEGIKE